MANWKALSLLSTFIFGAALAIVSISLSFLAQEPVDECISDLQLVHGIYGIFGPIMTLITIFLLIRQSPAELQFYHTYVLGIGLKPLPGDPKMYATIKPGNLTPQQSRQHASRLDALKSRYNHIIQLTLLPKSIHIFFALLGLLSLSWAASSYALASMTKCTTITPLRVWAYICPTLVIFNTLFQWANLYKIRPQSLSLDTAIDAYERGIERHQIFLETKGASWSPSESDSSDYDSSDYTSSEEDEYDDDDEEEDDHHKPSPRGNKRLSQVKSQTALAATPTINNNNKPKVSKKSSGGNTRASGSNGTNSGRRSGSSKPKLPTKA